MALPPSNTFLHAASALEEVARWHDLVHSKGRWAELLRMPMEEICFDSKEVFDSLMLSKDDDNSDDLGGDGGDDDECGQGS